MIVLSTVPSTGTNFMRKLLHAPSKGNAMPNIMSYNGDTPVCFTHCFQNRWPQIKQAGLDGATFVTPMRDPALSIGTWLFHRVTEKEMENRWGCYSTLLWTDSWFEDVRYVPIDLHHLRDDALRAVNPDLKTAWKPENANGRHKFAATYYEGQPWRCWPDGLWDRLKNEEDRLRPLLERIGYRNLLWWTK